ncbi:hypothetical protein C5E07_05840 [Pseudoclavibacter sp. RFBJ3]|uniref:N-acetylmuramoyl-L-alanine amidase n=1 Tax=unclassified Pseudoclavibacter TaxID=2615177 RepID=UPI000CE8E079|nr:MULTISPECIES: peptidoglycan recognition family protein [unclassified Pseudoclavibacter]PPF75895.1 hypothetical protein C5B99_08470 [Pseudoclavibacter sp. Z016]PPF85013.1 hypothetical protein C5C12_06550 [Pseudoclavibacter sp. RFBJ5]PPF94016.1 hypothetical protein C5E07_05840 [Pseudoclavibacter sp. RFBJ3]PPF98733.1 hypothetical protein C5C19_08825 [Pseudoclavibacter sp. RFBH5]PPG02792.1 hypothetical protein C5E06_10100 [Pseudoclavibacter sp. RFBI5]
MTFSNTATGTSGNGGQFSNRSARVDRFIVHHAATASLSAVLSMMSTGSRQVSSNYVIKDEQILGVVPEEKRAWTSGSAAWDGRAITVETCNSATGDASGWPISETSCQSLARLIADCSTRYGFPLNRDTVIGHRELYTRYGASYSTACPGGINLDRLVAMALEYQAGGDPATATPAAPKPLQEETMYPVFVADFGHALITPTYVRKIVDLPHATAKYTIAGLEKISKPVVVLPFPEFYGIWSNVNAGTKDDSSTGKEIQALAKKLGIAS